MTDYYSKKLSGERLQRVYEIGSPRIQQYLASETGFVISRVPQGNTVLELGCGYGRVVFELSKKAGTVTGIDNSSENIDLARKLSSPFPNCEFFEMDALNLNFEDNRFDVVICIQNGICSFIVNKEDLIKESIRVTKPGGIVLFSSYSDKFWEHRLNWFEVQAKEGLIGSIDYTKTRRGKIVCKDGFHSGRMRPEDFAYICTKQDLNYSLTEIDNSSIFCEIKKPVLAGS